MTSKHGGGAAKTKAKAAPPSYFLVDHGAYSIKANRSTETEPRIVPNCITKAKNLKSRVFVGDQLRDCKDFSGLYYQYAFQKGYLVNWELEKQIWDHMLGPDVFGMITSSSSSLIDSSLVLTEPPFNFNQLRDPAIEIIFEEFGFGKLFCSIPAVFSSMEYNIEFLKKSSLPSNGHYNNHSQQQQQDAVDLPQCCVVVDSGFSFTHIVPCCNNRAVAEGIRRIDVGGKVLTNHLKEVISYRQLMLMEETYVVNTLKEDISFMSEDIVADLRLCKRSSNATNPYLLDYVLPDFVSINRGFSLKPGEPKPESFTGHEQILRLCNERFAIPELLFRPSDIGIQQMGIAEAIVHSISSLPEESRNPFIQLMFEHCLNVFNSYNEVRSLVPDMYTVNVFQHSDPISYAWLGQQSLVTCPLLVPIFEAGCISRSDYTENGLRYCTDLIEKCTYGGLMAEDRTTATRVMALLSSIALVSIGLGIYAYVLNVESNRCEMTYMYEMPAYIPVPMDADKEIDQQSRYGLFVYGEGIYAEQLVSELRYNKLTGVPVLFVPGSGGSYAQVRSLASVLLRKGQALRSRVEFNVFSVDFGADFSALDGALLAKQSDFVARCLKRISQLYPQRTKNSEGAGIIVYGHSMGGIVALTAAKMLDSQDVHGTVAPLLMTFATPFARPVAYVDPHLDDVYANLFDDVPKDLFLLSVGGGFRDHLVPSHLTVTNFSETMTNGLLTNTMAVPLAWASADHKCIVWCRQVVLATARTLYTLISTETRKLPKDLNRIEQVVKEHFQPNGQLPYLPSVLPSSGNNVPRKSGYVKHDKAVVAIKQGTTATVNLPAVKERSSDILVAVVHNWNGRLEFKTGDDNKEPVEISSSLLLPPLYSEKKIAFFKVEQNDQSDSASVLFQPNLQATKIQKLAWAVDVIDSSTWNVINVTFPTMNSAFFSFFGPVTIASGIKSRLFLQLILQGFESPYMAANLRLIPTKCSSKSKFSSTPLNGSLIHFGNVDNIDESYEYGASGKTVSLTLRKQVASASSLPRVSLVLDPSCIYDVEIKWSLPDVTSQYIRFVGHLLPTYLGLVLIAFVMGTLRTLEKPADTSLVAFVFFQCKPVQIVALSKLIHLALGKLNLPVPVPFDFDTLSKEGENIIFGALPVLLYFFVLGFFAYYAQIISVIFSVIGRPISRVTSWFLRPSLFLAIFLQLAGVVIAVSFSAALSTVMIYFSFLIPFICLSSCRKSWQLQRFTMSMTLLSLWFALIAAPTLLHQFFLPASDGGFVLAKYRPALAAVDGKRFDTWLVTGVCSFAAGSVFYTLSTLLRLKTYDDDGASTLIAGHEAVLAPRLLQIGAIVVCLFASRTLYRAPTIIGMAVLFSGIAHFFLSRQMSAKSEDKKRPKQD